jgi:hypothetical protein
MGTGLIYVPEAFQHIFGVAFIVGMNAVYNFRCDRWRSVLAHSDDVSAA